MKNRYYATAVGVVFALVIFIALVLSGCGNSTVFDTTWTFEEAIVQLPGGKIVDGELTKWTDFDSSDMIQVTIDGKTYLTHSSNVVMISEG